MSVSLVEREQASTETLAFYDKSEERFQALLNIFKVFGHQPEIVDAVFVITIYIAVSKFGDALGVELESMFDGVQPILKVNH